MPVLNNPTAAPNADQRISIDQITGNGLPGVPGDGTQPAIGIPNWSYPLLYNGGTNTWDRNRTPNVFKAIQTSGGAVWTPQSGKKFRLMKFILLLYSTSTLAVAGVTTCTLLDNATNMNLVFPFYVPAAASNTPGFAGSTGWIDLGNGYLSIAANNALTTSFNTAFTAGGLQFIGCGTEE